MKDNLQWQPIKTAPRDGVDIVADHSQWIAPAVIFFATEEYFELEFGDRDFMEEGWYFSNPSLYGENITPVIQAPTHWIPLPWMPLPELTTEEKNDE